MRVDIINRAWEYLTYYGVPKYGNWRWDFVVEIMWERSGRVGKLKNFTPTKEMIAEYGDIELIDLYTLIVKCYYKQG